jgi:hypothetical protein
MIDTPIGISAAFAKIFESVGVVFPVREYTKFERFIFWISEISEKIAFVISAPPIAVAVGIFRGVEKAVNLFWESDD